MSAFVCGCGCECRSGCGCGCWGGECGCGCVGGCVGVSVLMFVGVWVDVGEMLSYGGTSWGYCG